MRRLVEFIVILAVLIFISATPFSAHAEDYAMFSYTGRIKVQGTLHSGTAYLKFAIVNNPGDTTLWSNDGTSIGGNEPASYITTTATDGVFSLLIGDPALGFDPINRSIFNHPSQIKLRTWFSHTGSSFQQLLPDQKLINIELLGLRTGTDDFTIYVDGTNGNDDNDGLTTNTAKKTIQSAIDVLPERLNATVTIDIADGTYYERPVIHGISVKPGKRLYINGDTAWMPGSGTPSVVVSGASSTSPTAISAGKTMAISNCTGVYVTGLELRNGYNGLHILDSTVTIKQCLLTNNYSGFQTEQSMGTVYDCVATANIKTDGGVEGLGFIVSSLSQFNFYRCEATSNEEHGIQVYEQSLARFHESGNWSDNIGHGVVGLWNSGLIFGFDGYAGQITGNGAAGLRLNVDSFSQNHTTNSFSGNGVDTNITNGSAMY